MDRTISRSVALAALLALIPMGSPAAAAAASHLTPKNGEVAYVGQLPEQVIAENTKDHDDPMDHAWDSADAIPIVLAGSSVKSSSKNVLIKGGSVTVTAAGTYRIAGTLLDGQITVDTSDKGIVRLILDNANVTSKTSVPLIVNKASEVMIVLETGSKNQLVDGIPEDPEDPEDPWDPWNPEDPEDPWDPWNPNPPDDPKPGAETERPAATLFSKANLTISGTGALAVTGNAKDGISSNDGLVIDSGAITVDAVDDGIRGKDYVVVNGGTIRIESEGDGIKSTNDKVAGKGYVSVKGGDLAVTAGGDGLVAETDLTVTGGKLALTTGGGHLTPVGEDASAKGMKAGTAIAVGGGTVVVDSADDTLHSRGAVSVSGGALQLASGDDGISAVSSVDIVNGSVTVIQSYEAIEALKITIQGGQVTTTSSNDGVNAKEEGVNEFSVAPNAYIAISGGNVAIDAGDDGIDSNGVVKISGGSTIVEPDYDGIDSNGNLIMTGGVTVINGAGVSTFGQNGLEILGSIDLQGGTILVAGMSATWSAPPTKSKRGWLFAPLKTRSPADTVIQIVPEDDDTPICSYLVRKNMQQILFSSDAIENGEEYDIYVGGTVSGTGVGGMYSGGDLDDAVKIGTFEAGEFKGGGRPY